MSRIPDSTKRKVRQLVAGGAVERDTVKKTKVSNPAREIAFEIGDEKQDDFFPQWKTKHWQNECNFSARLVTKGGSVIEHDGKLAYDDGEKIARFYEKDTGDEDGGFEFDVVLLKKPKGNKLTWTLQHKGLDFFYQPELTQEEIDEGAERPENVVGSYAVYHKTKKNNIVGGKEYRTGKAFHIYRPYFQDANGDWAWGELNIDPEKNEMTVTAPRGWLAKAVYPVVCDPTFGYDTAGASAATFYYEGSGDSGMYLRSSQSTLPGNGSIDSISGYINHGGFQTDFWEGRIDWGYVIYSDNAGVPDTFLGKTLVTNTDFTDVTQWWTLSADGQIELDAGDYWMTPYFESADATYYGHEASIYYDSGGSSYDLVHGLSDPVPDPYATPEDPYDDGTIPEVIGTRRYSIYATYTASSGPTEESATATLDALTKEQQSDTATLDALTKTEESTTATLDALIREQLFASVTLDTLILDRQNATATLDSFIEGEGSTTATVDGYVDAGESCGRPLRQADGTLLTQANGEEICIVGPTEESATTSFDALVQAEKTAANTLDALILARETTGATLDALTYVQAQETATVNALVRERLSLTADLDALIKARAEAAATVDALVQEAGEATASIDSYVIEESAGQAFATVDAVIEGANSALAALDGLIAERLEATANVDAAVFEELSQTATLDALVAAQQTLTASTDALVRAQETAAVAVDGLVLEQQVLTAALDAIIAERRTATATLDAAIAERRTATTAVDTMVREEQAATGTLDAVVSEQASATGTLDAYVFEPGDVIDPYCPKPSPFSAMASPFSRPAKDCP